MLKENKNILDKWLEFRTEDLAMIDEKDKKHFPHIDKYTKNIQNIIHIFPPVLLFIIFLKIFI